MKKSESQERVEVPEEAAWVHALVRDAIPACRPRVTRAQIGGIVTSSAGLLDFFPSLLRAAVDFVSNPLTTLKMPFLYSNSVCMPSFETYCLCK